MFVECRHIVYFLFLFSCPFLSFLLKQTSFGCSFPAVSFLFLSSSSSLLHPFRFCCSFLSFCLAPIQSKKPRVSVNFDAMNPRPPSRDSETVTGSSLPGAPMATPFMQNRIRLTLVFHVGIAVENASTIKMFIQNCEHGARLVNIVEIIGFRTLTDRSIHPIHPLTNPAIHTLTHQSIHAPIQLEGTERAAAVSTCATTTPGAPSRSLALHGTCGRWLGGGGEVEWYISSIIGKGEALVDVVVSGRGEE